MPGLSHLFLAATRKSIKYVSSLRSTYRQNLESFLQKSHCELPSLTEYTNLNYPRCRTSYKIQKPLELQWPRYFFSLNGTRTISNTKDGSLCRRHFSSFIHRVNRRGPVLSADGTVHALIAINAGVLFLWNICSPSFMFENFTVSWKNLKEGRVHTLLTSAFSHMDMGHFFRNMIGLYFFGISMGRALGPQFLLKLYALGGIAGSIFYLLHDMYRSSSSSGIFRPSSFAMGASAAVNAVIMLQIFLFPRAIHYVNFLIPVPAAVLGACLIATDIWRSMHDSRISGAGHLGGAAIAALMWARIRLRVP